MRPSPLLALCESLVVVFARSGYEVLPPLALGSADPAGRGFQINLCNLLEAGGHQEVLIELTGRNACRVYTGEVLPRGDGAAPPRPWRRFECALDTPDLGRVLLATVRAMLLDES